MVKDHGLFCFAWLCGLVAFATLLWLNTSVTDDGIVVTSPAWRRTGPSLWVVGASLAAGLVAIGVDVWKDRYDED